MFHNQGEDEGEETVMEVLLAVSQLSRHCCCLWPRSASVQALIATAMYGSSRPWKPLAPCTTSKPTTSSGTTHAEFACAAMPDAAMAQASGTRSKLIAAAAHSHGYLPRVRTASAETRAQRCLELSASATGERPQRRPSRRASCSPYISPARCS
eukprot:3933012-Rhodomonas_salina.3